MLSHSGTSWNFRTFFLYSETKFGKEGQDTNILISYLLFDKCQWRVTSLFMFTYQWDRHDLAVYNFNFCQHDSSFEFGFYLELPKSLILKQFFQNFRITDGRICFCGIDRTLLKKSFDIEKEFWYIQLNMFMSFLGNDAPIFMLFGGQEMRSRHAVNIRHVVR